MGNNKIEMYSGNSKTINISITEADGSAVDITGATLKLTVKERTDMTDTQALIQVTGSIVSGTAGTATFTIGTSSSNRPEGKYLYDITLKQTSGTVSTVVRDDFEIITNITSTI